MIGISSLPKNLSPEVVPKLNCKRAVLVVSKIDEILAWEKTGDQERAARYLDLGRYLREVRSGKYWRLDNLRSFDDFLAQKFPHSRRKAYYLMAIYEGLPTKIHGELKNLGWTKAVELAKIGRREGEDFEDATWLHKAQQLSKEELKREVRKWLTGKQTRPKDLLYFQVSKNQLEVIEQALEIAASIFGADKSRSYCLEMLCADFVAEASREADAKGLLFGALAWLVDILSEARRLQLLEIIRTSLELAHTETTTGEA